MRILLISNIYPSKQKKYGGIFVKNQYEYLRNELKQDIHIYAMERKFTNMVGSVLKYLKSFLLFFPQLFRKYNIVHVHFFFPMIILAIVYKIFHPKSKIIVTFHGADFNKFIYNNLSKRIFSSFLSKCDYVISVGRDLSSLIESKLDRKPNIVLSAGVDHRLFYQEENTAKEFDFIFVGSFTRVKGLDILLQAIKIIDKQEIKYCLVGSGELEEEVIQMQNQNITFLGHQTHEQLRILYNKSKYLVLPSRAEAFGLVVSEALFCGTPVIVSSTGGLKDQVKEGKNGFILEKNDPHNLVETMERSFSFDESEYLDLVSNSLKTNKEYSLKEVCNKLVDIYEGIYYEK